MFTSSLKYLFRPWSFLMVKYFTNFPLEFWNVQFIIVVCSHSIIAQQNFLLVIITWPISPSPWLYPASSNHHFILNFEATYGILIFSEISWKQEKFSDDWNGIWLNPWIQNQCIERARWQDRQVIWLLEKSSYLWPGVQLLLQTLRS